MRRGYLLRPASNQCNLNCAYCLTKDYPNHGFMTEATMEAIAVKTVADPTADALTFAFSGGEPTLASLASLQRFCALVARENTAAKPVTLILQTNGFLLDERWAGFLKACGFLVGLSMDGDQATHDLWRSHSYKKTMAALELLRRYEVPVTAVTVVTPDTARSGAALWSFYERYDIDAIQLLYPIATGHPDSPYALTPQMTAGFLKEFFFRWIQSFSAGHYRSVNIFDDLVALAAGGRAAGCGMQGACRMQTVIEADGRIYPCDLAASQEFCCGSILTDSLEDIRHAAAVRQFADQARRYNNDCGSCLYRQLCYGNCRLASPALYDGGYCGYRDFLAFAWPDLQKLARQL